MSVKTYNYYAPQEILKEIEKIVNIPRMTKLHIEVDAEVDAIPMVSVAFTKYIEGKPNGNDEQK